LTRKCQGSFLKTKEARDLQLLPPPSPEAKLGTRLHSILAGQLEPETNEEKDIFSWSQKVVSDLVSGEPVKYDYKELALGIEGQYAGTADRVILTPDKIILVDWKTGYNDVDMPGENLQIRTYAYALMSWWERDCLAAIAYTMPRKVRTGLFKVSDIEKLETQIFALYERAKSEKPEYSFGPHCRWCGGAVVCDKMNALWGDMLRGIPCLKEKPGELFVLAKVIGEVAQGLEERIREEILERKRSGRDLPEEVKVYMASRWQVKPLKDVWPVLKKLGLSPEEVLANSYARESWLKDVLDEETFKEVAEQVQYPVVKLASSA